MGSERKRGNMQSSQPHNQAVRAFDTEERMEKVTRWQKWTYGHM